MTPAASSPLHINVPYDMVRANIERITALQVGIEVYINNVAAQQADRKGAREMGRELSDRGVTCTAHGPFMDLSPGGVDQEIRAISVEKLQRAIEMARLLGAKSIVIHGGYDRWRFGGHEELWLENSIKTWTELLKDSGDVTLLVENIFEQTPATIIELLGHFKEKNIGFCFDSGHFNLFSTLTLEEWLLPLKEKIREFHIHDNHGKSDEHLPIGQGIFPFRELKQFVKRLNGVVFTAEISAESLALETIKRAKEFLS